MILGRIMIVLLTVGVIALLFNFAHAGDGNDFETWLKSQGLAVVPVKTAPAKPAKPAAPPPAPAATAAPEPAAAQPAAPPPDESLGVALRADVPPGGMISSTVDERLARAREIFEGMKPKPTFDAAVANITWQIVIVIIAMCLLIIGSAAHWWVMDRITADYSTSEQLKKGNQAVAMVTSASNVAVIIGMAAVISVLFLF